MNKRMNKGISTRREFLRQGAAIAGGAAMSPLLSSAQVPDMHTAAYVCPPCGCAMDGRVFDAPGKCPACGMTLVAQQGAPLPFEPTTLAKGRGAFVVAGGAGREAKRITVAYYMPTRFTPASRVLLVVPGSGRNAADYREPWVARAEAANVLVASLGYPEADYDFAAYQLGGVVENLQLRNTPPLVNGELPSVLRMRDEDISFTVNPHRETWIFPDFDRIFALLVKASGSSATQYDIFGHSAGGQILHRLALFQPQSNARRILAANAGLYTLPILDEPQISGLAGTGVGRGGLTAALAAPLHIMLGALDNDAERGGTQLHTPHLDQFGTTRLERGHRFFAEGQARARAMGVPFGWTLQIVPGVGHDHEGMGAAAARELYGIQ